MKQTPKGMTTLPHIPPPHLNRVNGHIKFKRERSEVIKSVLMAKKFYQNCISGAIH